MNNTMEEEVAWYTAAHNQYKVDKLGNVYLLDGESIKSPAVDRDGYLFYTFHSSKSSHFSKRAARVVWEAWNGEIPEGLTVDHIDGDRSNNSIANLRLLSPEDNVREAKAIGYSYLSPEGDACVGKNIAAFCREHSLNRTSMGYVNSGKLKQYKGWTKL